MSKSNPPSTAAAAAGLRHDRRAVAFDTTALTHGFAYLVAGYTGNPLHPRVESPLKYTLRYRLADSTMKCSI